MDCLYERVEENFLPLARFLLTKFEDIYEQKKRKEKVNSLFFLLRQFQFCHRNFHHTYRENTLSALSIDYREST